MKKIKKALITGITGQDGSYLAELLLAKGYEVHGIIRRASTFNTHRIEHIFQDPHEKSVRLKLVYADLNDASSLNKVIRDIRPDEIYNLAAQSHVRVSFNIPEYTAEITGLGCIRILEAIREAGFPARFYQASSSELFGNAAEVPQNEKTPFYPCSPYAAAKAYAFYMTRTYREAYGIFAVNGILFNHESPRRGETFVTRKVTRGLARIKYGLQDKLYLGNLNAKRDWGYAGDYVKAMWLMLHQPAPDDYVVATGETHSVRDFVEACFEYAGMPLSWSGKGVREKGIEKNNGRILVEIDPRYFRPAEVDLLLGDATKACIKLGWEPSVRFSELVRMMVTSDMDLVRKQVKGSRKRVIDREFH